MLKHLLLAVAIAACSGGSPPPSPDATPANQAYGAKCGAASDTSPDCMSGVCTNSFDNLGYNVCSQKCTMLMATDPSCPASPGAQFCNKKGYCKPF